MILNERGSAVNWDAVNVEPEHPRVEDHWTSRCVVCGLLFRRPDCPSELHDELDICSDRCTSMVLVKLKAALRAA